MESEQVLTQNKLCRTCMSSGDDFTSLFKVVNIVNKEEPLNSILLKCTSIQVTSNDIYPQNICKVCLDKLTACCLFRELCYQTHERLGQLYQNGNLPYSCMKAGDSQLPKENTTNRVIYKQEVVEKKEIIVEKTEYVNQDSYDNQYNDISDGEANYYNNSANYDAVSDYKNSDNDSRDKNFGPNENLFNENAQNGPGVGSNFSCSECTKVFRSKYTMLRHMKIHSNGEKLKCKICSKQFTRVADVKRHMSTHTGNKPYCCVVCQASFTQSGSLAVHMRKHEDFKFDKKTSKMPDEKPYLCSMCGMAFKHSSSLTIHVRRHVGDKPYCCSVCNMRFVSSGRLTSHMRVHTGERPFPCKYCGKCFAQSTVAGKHIKTHSNMKPHQCSYCLKTFSTLYYLNIHKRSHTGEKPHECNICHKTFADPKNLKQHRNIHSENKAYLCIICGKSFRRSHHLKNHMKIHAKGSYYVIGETFNICYNKIDSVHPQTITLLNEMARPRKSIGKILKHFCDNTTIHACNFLTMEHISIYEKIFWALINVVTITVTIIWIRYLWLWYLTDPTFVNFDGTIPLHKVEHPGVAICNVNKISKRRAYEFAKELSLLMKENNITAIMEDIRLIGNLYNFNTYGEDRFERVQEMLDKYDNRSDIFDPTARLVELTTPCDEILQKCRWDSTNYPCEELFFSRMTFDGLCCVFNYIRPSERSHLYTTRNRFSYPSEPEMSHGPGIQFGLQVILNTDLDDYFYTTLETTGFKVIFFLSRDFPDVLSGSLKEYLVGTGHQTLFNVEVDVIRSTPQIKSIPIDLRKCMYESEGNTSFGVYRQSDCFVECKLRSMQALCNCIPFTMPIEPASSKFRSVCNLVDMPCCHQYFDKWTRYYPKEVDGDNLVMERHDSLNCDCLPVCDSLNYNVYTNSFSIENVDRNMSEIIIVFVKGFADVYKIDLAVTWFEIISAYGGLMGLVMGLSLISIIEIAVLLCKLVLCYVYNLYYQL